jgi:uncharacterized protein with FMN-binding domain
MRRGPTVVMSAVTGLVVVVALRAGSHPSGTTPAAASGVVQPVVTPTPRKSAVRRSPAARATATPRRTAHATPRATAATHHTTVSSPTRSPAARPVSVVVNGASVDTPYGPVQVQITLSNHHIVKAEAIDYPRGSGRDQEINSYAIPQLDQETLQAQSAQIDTVSGATYTSEGYRGSLQSALDSAHAAGAW